MRFILFGLIFLFIAYMAAILFVKLDARALVRRARPVGIALAVLAGLFFCLTGRFGLARRVLAAAFAFLAPGSPFSGWSRGPADMFDTDRGPSGQTSKVKTRMIEMLLDHESGSMEGRVIDGQFRGMRISDLDKAQLALLHDECIRAGDQSSAVLEAFLDRAHPDWRTDPAFSNRQSGGERTGGGGKMTVEEALEVLGLDAGAGRDDVVKAHRRLMKQYHPDQGGSDYLASKINEAKDILLGDA